MRCDEWSERLAGRVCAEPGESDVDLERHLESCARCRAELAGLKGSWDELARLPEPPVPTERMRARLARAMADSGRTRPNTLSWVGRVAAAALIAAAGFLAGRFWNAPAGAAPPDPRPRYLLLLHERPGSAAETPEQARRVVEEYKAWARRLRAQGKLVGGEKLSNGGTLVSSAGDRKIAVPPAEVGGYFVIRAATREEALEIARSCPHVGRGGTVELRAIENV
jgi:hypothetical protein